MDLFKEIINGNKLALSRAITLLESTKIDDQIKAQKIIKKCIPLSGKSIRIGITGIPGVGKSTFIESLGNILTTKNKKVAVLAIDPSSEKSKGSILGDKSRMHKLSIDKNAFIRPSPNNSRLGGIAYKTKESILLCEAAGYDIIIIETVGVGQSETSIKDIVDFCILLMLTGTGDEIQGIKRGIMEIADMIIINKADGENLKKAKIACNQYKNSLQILNKNIQVKTCSALENIGIDEAWEYINKYHIRIKKNGELKKNRIKQKIFWLHKNILEELGKRKYEIIQKSNKLKILEKELIENKSTIYNIIEKL